STAPCYVVITHDTPTPSPPNIHTTYLPAALPTYTRNLTETNSAADISSSGTLTISDVDSPATFVAQAGTVGTYGTFAIDSAGAWTYAASSARKSTRPNSTHTCTSSLPSAAGPLTTVTINTLVTNVSLHHALPI